MKTIIIFIIAALSFSAFAQNNSDIILAQNNINDSKEKHTLLTSEFKTIDAEKLDGIYKLMAEDGALKEVRSFKRGTLDGTWLEYDDKQNLIAVANYKDDLKHGKWVIWDAKGTKRYELFYKNGKRTGTWKSWNESGELISKKDY